MTRLGVVMYRVIIIKKVGFGSGKAYDFFSQSIDMSCKVMLHAHLFAISGNHIMVVDLKFEAHFVRLLLSGQTGRG